MRQKEKKKFNAFGHINMWGIKQGEWKRIGDPPAARALSFIKKESIKPNLEERSRQCTIPDT